MAKPRTLVPMLADLAIRAGSVTALREAMGDVPWQTLSRWNALLRQGKTLPRSARTAIAAAQKAIPPAKEPNV